jgi:glycine/D-amino acid oxidase-like deaminating enzyme
MRFKGLERIQKYFGKKEIDFRLCGGYELYEEGVLSADKLQETINYLNSLMRPLTDTKKTYRLADEKINQFGFGKTAHLVENRREGYLHSGKLLQALLQRVQSMGVSVLNGIEITSIVPGDKKVLIETAHPFSFTAEKVLLCTNAFTKKLIPEMDIVRRRILLLPKPR